MRTWFSFAIASLCLSSSAFAATITAVSPTGISNTANQIRVTFSDKMINLSTPNQGADLFALSCTPNIKGRARWNDDRTWIFDVESELDGNFLSGGTRCQLRLKDDVKSLAGAAMTGKKEFTFQIDGPNIIRSSPSFNAAGQTEIDEDQIFMLFLDTDVDLNSVLANAYFSVSGRSSAVPIKLIEGEQRREIIRAEYGTEVPKGNFILIQARENFPAKSKVSLVWGVGIKAKGGMSRQTKHSYELITRELLTAEFTCQRENAKANCSPLTPLEVRFSAPIATTVAKQIELVTSSGKVIKPDLARSKEKTVSGVSFAGPLPENQTYTIRIPADVKDEAGRALANSKMFPLTVKTAEYPPLAKFAADFGVIEANEKPNLMPATLRNLEAKVIGNYAGVNVGGATVKLNAQNFPEVIKWMQRLDERDQYADRNKSLLGGRKDKKRFEIPLGKQGKAFEVVGIPLPGSGFYVVELESKILGNSLIEETKPDPKNPKAASSKDRTMYVPAGALVTNLAVHTKWGVESSLFWVTALDSGTPVSGAAVRVHDCTGKQIWQGTSDKDGIVRYAGSLKNNIKLDGCVSDGVYGNYRSGFFVTAQQGADFTFAHSGWTSGLDGYRFGVNAESPSWSSSTEFAHTIFARTLLRAGDTVNMKHLMRRPSQSGLGAVAEQNIPTHVVIEHTSGAKYTLPLKWDKVGFVAETTLEIPKDAKLGTYQVTLVKNVGKDNEVSQRSGSFRVEDFKVPLMKAMISLPKQALVQPGTVDPQLTVAYQNGGPAANLDVVFRHQLTDASFTPVADYDDFEFMNGKVVAGVRRSGEFGSEEKKDELITQKLKLSNAGAGAVKVGGLSGLTQPKSLNMEMDYSDASGEIQTVSRTATIWPSDSLVGLRAQSWVSEDKEIDMQVVVLDLKQKPVANAAVQITGYKVETYSHRKRLVGGFYAYENVSETTPATVNAKCSGSTDARGLLFCKISTKENGEIRLMAETTDKSGRHSYANASVYVVGKDNFWFDAQDTDRIDLIPEQRRYEPGQTARLQVRMPFRSATALITTEREGVIDARIETISGNNPTITVPITDQYAPNIFISTFLVRGRIPDSAGEPYKPGQDFIVDLNKPSFKMGLAQLYVKWAANELKVSVNPNKEVYQPREEATVTVNVKDAKGQPVKGEFAIAVVDEGLLQLQPNGSWNLLEAMMGRRPWSVQTATNQMQVVGKRHYGQKAVAHGGDGGSQVTRELFDTLLTWQGRVKLNDAGEATVKFKLNDSLTKFRVVAVAQNGLAQFGTGQKSISATQDLIAMPSQALLSRVGDKFDADLTLRNTTKKAIKVAASGKATFTYTDGRSETKEIGSKSELLSAESAKVLSLGKVEIPKGVVKVDYEYTITGDGGQKDSIKVSQSVKALIVPRTQMSQLEQVSDKPVMVGVERPATADPVQGGVRVTLVDSLARGLDSVKEYFRYYLFENLETLVSRAVATNDLKVWDYAMKKLAGQLDENGLAKWYPMSKDGSYDLTTYIVAISKDAGLVVPTATNDRMISALRALAEGRLRGETLKMTERELLLRRVSAMAALGRHGLARVEWLKSLTLPPVDKLPTVTLLDLVRLVYAVSPGQAADQSARFTSAIRARMTLVGTRFEIAPDTQAVWWMMTSRAGNQARLISMALSNIELIKVWKDDLPRIQSGLMNYFRRGSWDLPVTNAWAAVAIRQFAKVIENGKVSGTTKIDLASEHKEVDWAKNPGGAVTNFIWPNSGAGQVTVSHRGTGKPWAFIATVAAVPTKDNDFVGLQVRKTIKPIIQSVANKWTRGDVAEVTLKIKAQLPTSQVALFDPIPSGAKILGAGLAQGDPRSTGWVWPEYDEKSYDGYRAVYSEIPTTEFEVVYRFQLNVNGSFNLPATRLEALYTPETYAETANAPWVVAP